MLNLLSSTVSMVKGMLLRETHGGSAHSLCWHSSAPEGASQLKPAFSSAVSELRDEQWQLVQRGRGSHGAPQGAAGRRWW